MSVQADRPSPSVAGVRRPTPWPFTKAFLREYARNRVNLLLLAVVPTVFVAVVASSIADAAKLLGGVGGPKVETATAGWAAGFLAGIAMYFQVAATREVDRRLVIAGLAPTRLALSRLLTGLLLAAGASAAALLALALRVGIDHPARAVAGTLMFAVVYVAIGSLAGTVFANPVNGTVFVLFVWIIDVFFGPVMGAVDRTLTRGLPTHFISLWMVDLPSRHGGRLGDLGLALLWSLTAIAIGCAVITWRTSTAHRHRQRVGAGSVLGQLLAVIRTAWRESRRNPVQWLLFLLVPLIFILAADAVTPDEPITLILREGGVAVQRTLRMPDVHGATMAPIAVAFLSALVGLFTLLDSRTGDRRAVLAGMRPSVLTTARLGLLALTVLAATGVSLAVTATVFSATQWPVYAAANLLLGLTYALIGALLAPLVGRVGGVFVAFLLPFLDIGITQSPMLHPEPTALSRFLPGYGGSRLLLDGALTATVDETRPLLIGLAWLVALTVIVVIISAGGVRAVHLAALPTRELTKS